MHFRITSALPDHEGGYLCVATNTAGTADVEFDVHVISWSFHSKAQLLTKLSNIRVP